MQGRARNIRPATSISFALSLDTHHRASKIIDINTPKKVKLLYACKKLNYYIC
jgi:hypothetical protein